jgi:AcrR family transcriptional regulator
MQKSPKSNKEPEVGRSRGRPRVFDRTAALAKATHLFWEKGFHATSISDLTHAMEIGSPSLYAAFGSKETLYVEALEFYRETYEGFIWDGFFSASTVREAIKRYLMDSAAALSGSVLETPRGCMVTLSSVGSEGYPELGELVRSGRAGTRSRLEERLGRAIEENEIPQSVEPHSLARFVQAVQSGMAVLSKDGASRIDLEAVAEVAILACDARFSSAASLPGRSGNKRSR